MTKKDEPDDVEETDGTGRSDDTGGSDLAELVRSAVSDALTKVGAGGRQQGDDAADTDDHDDTDDDVIDASQQTKTRRTHRDIEDDTETQVRAVLGKVRKEEETDARIAAIEERTAEKPPMKERKVSRALWGSAAK